MNSSQYKRHAADFADNAEQLAAYDSTGNCGVLAGPGSGKTKVLTAKVARVLSEDVHAPQGVACITYSNECRIELLKRLELLGVNTSPFLFVGTVHGYCLRHILRPYAKPASIELPDPMRVAGTADRTECGKAALGKVISADEQWGGFGGWGSWVERFRKSRGRDIEALDDRVEDLAIEYERQLRSRGLIDYDDITNIAAELVKTRRWVRDCIAAKHPVVAIDEYQDLGAALHDIVGTLCDHGVRVFGVGDPDQCIYEQLQDARPELLIEFAERNDVERVDLRINYRSGTTLVRIAAAALGEDRKHRAHRADTGTVQVHEVSAPSRKWNPRQEAHAKYAAKSLVPAILESDAVKPGDIGLLVQDRNMAQALAIEFAAEGFKYIRLDKGIPYERTPLVTWIADATTWCICSENGERPSVGHLLRDWNAIDRTGDRSRDIDTAWPVVVKFLWSMQGSDVPLSEWLAEFESQAAGPTGLLEEALERELESLEALTASTEEGGLHEATLVSEFAVKRGPPSHITIVTLHSAKGLEFPIVIMPLLDEGVFPRFSIKPETSEWREQRRLFYVGVTRAMNDLHVLYSREHGMSPFLADLVGSV